MVPIRLGYLLTALVVYDDTRSVAFLCTVRAKNVLSVPCSARDHLPNIDFMVNRWVFLAFSEGNMFIGGLSNFMMGGIQEGTMSGDIPTAFSRCFN